MSQVGRFQRCLVALAGGIVIAGCGSTVANTSTAAAGGATGNAATGNAATGGAGLGGPAGPALNGPSAATVGGAAAPGAGAATAGGTGGAGTGGSSGSGASEGPGGGAGSGGGGQGPANGVSATEITVGIPYATNGAAGNQAIGAAGVSFGDARALGQIVVNDINHHGGILGHRLAPVYYGLDAESTSTDDQQYAAACAYFTQDHHSFAVIGAPGDETFTTCLERGGALQVAEDVTTSDDATFQRHPFYVEPATLDLDRAAAQLVPALSAQHYFSSWDATNGAPGAAPVKVAVLTYDHPNFAHAVDAVLQPALAKAGFRAAMVERIAYPQRFADLSSEEAQIQNAVLQLRTANITHVVDFDASGTLGLFFLNDAESQHYRPRYGVTTQSAFGVLASTGDDPKAQFAGALGIGWYPIIDVPDQGGDTGPYVNAARKYCVALMRAGGQSFSDPNAERDALQMCDQLYLLRDSLVRGGALTRAAFVAGVNSVGSSFESATTPATEFSPTQHDGVAAVYYTGYEASCSCMRYAGGPHPVG